MFLLSGPEKLFALFFLITTMLSIGMVTGIAQLRSLLTSRNLLVRILLANFLVVPVVGFVIVRFMLLAPESAGALTLLACVPGGLTALQFTTKVKGEKTLAGAMLVLLNVSALLLSPLILRIFLPTGSDLAFPYGRILGFIALALLVPLGIGMYLCDRAPAAALKLSKVMGFASVVLFIAFMAMTKSSRKEAVASLGGPAVGAIVVFIVVSMAVGWFLGGPACEKRQLFATATSMRNVALCLLIARNAPSGNALTVPLVAFSLLMVTPNMGLTLYSAIRGAILARKAAGHTGKPNRRQQV